MKGISMYVLMFVFAVVFTANNVSAEMDPDEHDERFLISSKLRCLKCHTRFVYDTFCCQRGSTRCCGGGHHGVGGGGVIQVPVVPVVQKPYPVHHGVVVPIQPVVHKPQPVYQSIGVPYQPVVHKPQPVYQSVGVPVYPVVQKPIPVEHGYGAVGYPKPCGCGAAGIHLRSGDPAEGMYPTTATGKPSGSYPITTAPSTSTVGRVTGTTEAAGYP